MVFGFHSWTGGATRPARGSGSHQRDHDHTMEIAEELAAAGAGAAESDAAAKAAAALGPSNRGSSATAAGAGPGHVLNNGHAIKHLATHRGYAAAPDGVRLFYEIFESHLHKPQRHSKTGSGAPEMTTACFDVRATTGSPDSARTSGAASGSETTAEPPSPVARTSPTSSAPTVMNPAAAATSLGSPEAAGELATAAGVGAGSPTRGSGGAAAAAAAAAAALPTEGGGGGAVGGSHHQLRRISSCVGAEPPESAESGGGEKAAGGDAAARPSGRAPEAEPGRTTGAKEPAGEAGALEVANVLLVMGFAAGRHGWLPLIHHWMDQADSEPLHRLRARFCVFDNRGIGDSDSPPHSGSFSTDIMARDALAVMDHLGWHQAHVVGFSMGGMISLRLAVAAPQRLRSLTVLSVTNGGWQVIPTRWRALKLLLWAAAARTPRQRAHADVHFHFSRETLHSEIPAPCPASAGAGGRGAGRVEDSADEGGEQAQARRVEAALIDEYVSTSRECTPQPHAGLMGQLHAVWNHGLSTREQHGLRQLGVPFKIIHGYHDVMAMPVYGERIAKHTRAAFIMLNGGHFVARECAPEMFSASMGTRAVIVLCGLCLAAVGVTAEHGFQGLEFAPRFTRLLRQDLGSVASYLLPTEQPPLCAGQCCQADSYASPYGLTSLNSTQEVFGGRTYTTFFFILHSNHTCSTVLDQAGCCSASVDTVWVDVDPSLKVKYVSYKGNRLATAEQSQYGLKLGSLNLQVAQAKGGIPVAITVEGAADTLCPPPGLAPIAGLCELVVQGGTASNPNACCPTTITNAGQSSQSTPEIPAFQCAASLDSSPFKLVFDGVLPIAGASSSATQFVAYNFRLVATDTCNSDGVSNCCHAQLSYIDLKVTDLPISGVQLGGSSVNFTASSWNEPNSASYRSLIVDDLNLVADDLGANGLMLTVTVRLPVGVSAAQVDLCDASSDPHQGACSYFLQSEDGFCCPSGLALPTSSVPPPPPGTCWPSENVPAADTSMSLQYYERIASAATTTFAFLLANHNPAAGCTKSYCVDVCSWTLYVDPAVASQVAVGHENPANNGRQAIEAGSGSSPASLTFTYGPAGESTNTFYVTLPAGGRHLTDLCARNALPGQGARACAAVVRSASVYIMVFFDEADVIIVPGASPPPPPVEQMCVSPRAMSDSCLLAQAARYNTMLSTAVFEFPIAPATSSAACQPPAAPGDVATVHLLLSATTVDQLATRRQVRPDTGLTLDRNNGARWQVSTTAATSLSFQVQGPLGLSEVCQQSVTTDQPSGTCVVEVSGDLGCFRGYVSATADGRLIWVESESGKRSVGVGVIVPAVVLPLVALLVVLLVGVAWYRRRRGQQYYFMNSGSDDLDRPLATTSMTSVRDDMVTPAASTTDVQIRVPGASQGGAAPVIRR